MNRLEWEYFYVRDTAKERERVSRNERKNVWEKMRAWEREYFPFSV